MVVITSDQVRKAIVAQFPAAFTIVVDKDYALPTISDFEEFYKNAFIEGYKYTVDKFDCDDFAFVLNAFVRQQKYIDGSQYQWPMGIIMGVFDGVEGTHARNIVVCGDSVEMAQCYSVEPQTREIRLYGNKDYIACVVI